jgi:hypothetical protein
MAGFVPIAVVPAEGTIVELSFKKISAEEVLQEPAAASEPNERKVVLKMQNFAEDVDDLGDFAADIAEQPLEGSKHSKAKSLIEMRPKKYRKNFIVTQLRENSGQRNT